MKSNGLSSRRITGVILLLVFLNMSMVSEGCRSPKYYVRKAAMLDSNTAKIK